jgi:hypothetical protein
LKHAKVLEIRQKISKATEPFIIKLFYEETQRCGCHALIIAENISRRSLNFDFQTKEINNYREKMAFKIIDGKLFEEKLCADL